jgi:hypothetical protein
MRSIEKGLRKIKITNQFAIFIILFITKNTFAYESLACFFRIFPLTSYSLVFASSDIREQSLPHNLYQLKNSQPP